MMLGGIVILACPNCKTLLKKQNYLSMNTLGATTWSDQIIIGPMYRNSSSISHCPHCNKCSLTINYIDTDYIPSIFEMEFTDMMDHKVYNTDPKILEEQYKEAKSLQRPGLISLKESLEYIGKGEKEVRLRIWQIHNNSFRTVPIESLSPEEELNYKDNTKKLIQLHDLRNDDEKIIVAELYRNIGEFKQSKSILATFNGKDRQWVADQILLEIEKKNKYIFQLQAPYKSLKKR